MKRQKQHPTLVCSAHHQRNRYYGGNCRYRHHTEVARARVCMFTYSRIAPLADNLSKDVVFWATFGGRHYIPVDGDLRGLNDTDTVDLCGHRRRCLGGGSLLDG